MISEQRTVKPSRWSFVAAGFALFLVGCLSHTAFQGGRLTKSRGPFLSSLYLAQFQELDLNKNGQYTIAFRGFPSSPSILDIELIGRSIRDQTPVKRFSSQITLELDGTDGSKVCKVTGMLNEIRGVLDHHWVLGGGADSLSLWSPDCVELKIRRSQTYTLKITVESASESLGSLRARPRLYTSPFQ